MYELKIGEKIEGFAVTRKTELPDIAATLYEMEYEKCGAKLVFLDREDENKTFSVGFKTIPENSTGVFHIIEHSVLCGSKKYPTKEPFVELLKGSLNTFLNAMTFPDKTLYPISTRNPKDFLNLADVYLDAVFNPVMKEDVNVFYQEGWRREISDSGELSYNGVVYNEMKGAYSSPDELGESRANAMLFGDSCYGYDSGGNPEVIPELTYEEFISSYSRFYHPSNAYFFIDGTLDLGAILSLISSYIKDYDKCPINAVIPETNGVCIPRDTVEFEIPSEQSEKNRTRILNCYLAQKYDELLSCAAFDAALDAIAGTNEAPLKRAILDSGLCEKVSFYYGGSRLYYTLSLEFQNVKDGKEKELLSLFENTLSNILRKGINKEHIEAAINHMEFSQRERDMGRLPLGIVYNISVLGTWLYGGDPAATLSYTELFGKLRELVPTGYFEDVLREYFLENKNKVTLTLKPSATLGERRAEAEREFFKKEELSLTESDKDKIKEENRLLNLRQSAPDTPEALATIPSLSISDIPKELHVTPTEARAESGVPVITHSMNTGGISYVELFFDASDTEFSDMYMLPLFSTMLMNSPVGEKDAYGMQNLIKRELGEFAVSPYVMTRDGRAGLYIKITASALDGKRDELVSILGEMLYSAKIEDKATLSAFIAQTKLRLEASFTETGDSVGIGRALAMCDAEYAVREHIFGYAFYEKIRALTEADGKELDLLLEKMRAFYKKLFARERLTLAVSGECDNEFVTHLLLAVKESKNKLSAIKYEPIKAEKEAIAIPAQVGFAAIATKLSEIGERVSGALLVAKLILNYEYLWGEVRVKGGAYGVACRVRQDGAVSFSSYRDPSSPKSFDVFRSSAAFLREFVGAKQDLTKYIIGAIGEFDPYCSKPLEASGATANYLVGFTNEEKARIKREILDVSYDGLLEVADILDKFSARANQVTVAPKTTLDANKELYDKLLHV